ncbi:MAG: proteasome assembly chaperone family protein [Candidatus Hydrothermarchaeota archaeon]
MKVHIIEKENLKDCILISGFQGIGFTGYISVKHMIDVLKARRIGYIENPEMVPVVTVQNDRLSLPTEIYKHENLVIVVNEAFSTTVEMNETMNLVSNWARANKLKEGVLIGGLNKKFQTDAKVKIKGVATSKAIHRLKDLNIPILDPGLQVVGPLASLLAYCEINDFPAIALLPYAEERPDPQAAAIAIEVIEKTYEVDLKASKLLEEAENLEQKIKELIKMRTDQQQEIDSRMYI